MKEFIPKSFTYLRSGYSFQKFKKDLLAGIGVGIIALPLSMAFAIASGTTPEKGLITAIIAGFCISFFGGSRTQIGGPTGAFVVIVYDIIQRTGYEGLALSTLIASFMLILFGVFRIGSLIKFIPYPLVTGFTTGIAVIIFTSQIKGFSDLQSSSILPSILLACSSLVVILLIRRFIPKVPWAIGAVMFATLASHLLDLPIETIQTKFGMIPSYLPTPSFPSFSIAQHKFPEIMMDATVIAFLAAIESLLSAVIADGMLGSRHRSNCELVGQGIANFASIIFGGIPATGAIARTAANIKMGGQTPLSGMIHAFTIFLIIFFAAPLVSQIPMAALAAILIMVAWNMSELGHFISLLKAPVEDVLVLLSTFFLTIFVDLTVAISLGMILSLLFFVKKMSQLSKTVPVSSLLEDVLNQTPPFKENIPDGYEIYEIQGPLFFGAADMLKDLLVNIEKSPKVFILRLCNVPFIDASGMNALKEFYNKCKRGETLLVLTNVKGQAAKDLKKFGLDSLIGAPHIFPDLHSALAQTKVWLTKSENILKDK